MISIRLMGGLGNQMFQYAIARRLAHDRHTTLAMDMVFFDNITEVDTPREYELDCFKIQENFLKSSMRPIDNESRYSGAKGKLRLVKDRLHGKAWNIYKEKHHNFDPEALQVPNNTYLIGFWQTEDYFKDIRDVLLKDFNIKTPATGQNKKILEEIASTNSVSIHVRRGDYISNTNANKFHGTKGKAYYDAALKQIIKKRALNPTLFIFSDDPEWCKKNLKFPYKTVYVEGNKKGFEDMRLMMNCKHNIIANSSFSWWAGWLNRNPNKVVVAPKQWFNDLSVNTSDIIPSSWIKI